MSEHSRLSVSGLPISSAPAVEIIRRLRAAGWQALLAGGCVRDLLLGVAPQDFDVATSAPPDEVCRLFRPTRRVGAQFGVVLVGMRAAQQPGPGGERVWIEVATFRTDADYVDGRRPTAVTFCDARHDAQRRDFTINGMFLEPPLEGPPFNPPPADPLPTDLQRVEPRNDRPTASAAGGASAGGVLIDYVGGQADVERRLIRAIGDPEQRFADDHLRMLRAVRFAARFNFTIEPATAAAIARRAPQLAQVAAERRLDELTRMLAHPGRAAGWRMMADLGLAPYLAPGWPTAPDAAEVLARLPAEASAATAVAVLLGGCAAAEIERLLRSLAASNELRETVLWLVARQAALETPEQLSLAELKRLAAAPAFDELRLLAAAREPQPAAAAERSAALDRRLGAISPGQIAPEPLVTGEDLLRAGLPRGPLYKTILDDLYTRQLNEEIGTRADALAALQVELARRGGPGSMP